ncbi:MAG: TonB-dependent receptor [Pseudomonadales bacterium]|nr:TonB-dependent receptor [Pseudomonadales bacterium]
MKLTFRKKAIRFAIAMSIASSAGMSAVALADDAAMEEVVVTGTRGKPRTVADSPVPIDVFNSDAIDAVSHTDTNNVLQTLVPSYNVSRQPISDGATFIRPAQLRGMPTDKTLVLVNSKRRHRAALVTIGGSGTQGPDVATIPSSALKSIEVLRDGAAAQYGSDAIAGVINFILKDSAEGASLSLSTGEYYEGDGFETTISGNAGFPLGDSGFINISAERSESDFTSRSEQYCESWFCLDKNNPVYNPAAGYAAYVNDPTFAAGVGSASLDGDVVQPWGQPNTEAVRFFVNAGYDAGNGMELYGFANYSYSEADGGFFYRYPNNGTIQDLREPDGSIYNPLEKFPGGFTPRFFGEVSDYSMVGGLKGEFSEGFYYDLSARYGYDEVVYTLKNTINPSLGPNSPTVFEPGELSNEEIQLQADFVREIDAGLSSPLVMAFGLSFMRESYEVVEGDLASYAAGSYATPDPFNMCNVNGTPTILGQTNIAAGSTLDCADPGDPVYQVVGVGSNGFPGNSPAFSDTYERDAMGVYVDLSAEVTEQLFLQGAMRYEDYDDFDSELVGKVAFQYDISETVGIRGSVGTGFRAPTPGQQGTTNVSTRLPNGFPVATGLFPAGSTVSKALGASDLKPETSTNMTFGITAEFEALSVTLDFYRIDVEDRFYAISTLDVSTDPTSGQAYTNYLALDAAGVTGANSIGGVFYFTNAFDTSTQGMDLVLTYPLDWGDGSVTSLTASLNYNSSEFDSDPSTYLNAEDQYDFEHDVPEWRSVITAVHQFGPVAVTGRVNYYGEWENSNNSAALVVQKFDPTIFVDLEGSYAINEMFTVTVGGRNIFDEYPDKDKISDFCCGRLYSSSSVVGWQGGYYYMRLSADF